MTTATDDTTIARKLRLIRKHVNELTHLIPSDDAVADTTGLTREIERALGKYRLKLERSAAAEMEPIIDHDQSKRVDQRVRRAPVAVGKQYELVPKFKNEYTFNMPALVVGISDLLDTEIAKTLWSLIQSNAVKMTTGITAIQKYADNQGIQLKIEHKATVSNDDGLDGAWVGINRVQDGVERVAIK
ncbi:hypothetical protein LCGC14_2681840 [marine sediment metagenome]|uniref:Uncharacterized protein n=1 Tax=marine sediment metagenome TaxID=412755 RepID=A0A0F9CCV0_9ZZZZ